MVRTRWTWVVAIALTGAIALGSESDAKKMPYPPKQVLLSGLFTLADTKLDPARHPGCDPGSIGGATIGAYLALLIATSTEGEVHRLEIQCNAKPHPVLGIAPRSKRATAHWFCSVDSFQSDAAGESPWHYSLVFAVDRRTGKIHPDLFGCPGTP